MTNPTIQAFELVVAPAGDACFLWDALGTLHVAADADSAARWVATIAADTKTPRVAFQRGSAFGRLAQLALDQLGAPKAAAPEDATAVHLLIAIVETPSSWIGTIWPPAGGPKAHTNPASFGAALLAIAADPAQPKVPAGPPPDASSELLERGIAFLRSGTP